MKQLFVFMAASLPIAATAQNNSLSGNWREVRRTDSRGADIAFKDTISILFRAGNEYTWQKKGGFIYRDAYKIEKGALDMGSRYFKIDQQQADQLVLRDDDGTYEFRPYQEAPATILPKEAPATKVEHMADITGKWQLFKGTSAEAQKELDLTTRPKTIVIFDKPDENGDIGYLSAGKDPQDRPSWKINKLEAGILQCNGKTERRFEVSKTATELILKEGNNTFFFKQFRE